MKKEHLWIAYALMGLVLLIAPTDAWALSSIGGGMLRAICAFIKSPIITAIAAFSILGLLVVMSLNEDKGIMSKFLKVLIAVFAIIGLASVMALLGLPGFNC